MRTKKMTEAWKLVEEILEDEKASDREKAMARCLLSVGNAVQARQDADDRERRSRPSRGPDT